MVTLISASFNTPQITLTMLRSFSNIHPHLKGTKLLLVDNSTNDATKSLLELNRVPYILGGDNKAHSPTIDHCLKLAYKDFIENNGNQYALVVDTDIIFKHVVSELIEVMKSKNIHLYGVECGDRGGMKLHTRIHPWYMLVDLKAMGENDINFHDEEKLRNSDSMGLNDDSRLYYVGATFYEEFSTKKLNIANLVNESKWFEHFEGSSWHRTCSDPQLVQIGVETWKRYQKQIELVSAIDIKDYYV